MRQIENLVVTEIHTNKAGRQLYVHFDLIDKVKLGIEVIDGFASKSTNLVLDKFQHFNNILIVFLKHIPSATYNYYINCEIELQEKAPDTVKIVIMDNQEIVSETELPLTVK